MLSYFHTTNLHFLLRILTKIYIAFLYENLREKDEADFVFAHSLNKIQFLFVVIYSCYGFITNDVYIATWLLLNSTPAHQLP